MNYPNISKALETAKRFLCVKTRLYTKKGDLYLMIVQQFTPSRHTQGPFDLSNEALPNAVASRNISKPVVNRKQRLDSQEKTDKVAGEKRHSAITAVGSIIGQASDTRSESERLNLEEIYRSQVQNIPLLTREQEIDVARRIDHAKQKYRRNWMNNDVMLLRAVQILERVNNRELSIERALESQPASKRDDADKRKIIATNLPTITNLLRQNRQDFRTVLAATSLKEERLEAFRRMQSRRLKAVKLLEEIRPQTKYFKQIEDELKESAERMRQLKQRLHRAKRAGKPKEEDIAEMRRELRKLIRSTMETPTVLEAKLRLNELNRQQLKKYMDIMVTSNLRLVAKIAGGYQSVKYDFFDCVQDGNCGLIRAAEKFEHRLGYKFSTYATWWIRQAISRGVADNKETVRLPIRVQDLQFKINQAAEDLLKENGRHATDQELETKTGIKTADIKAIRKSPRPMPLQGVEEDHNLCDILISSAGEQITEYLDNLSLRNRLGEVLATLTPREIEILKERNGIGTKYGVKLTLEQVGEQLGITRERVRQIETNAINKIRGNPRLMHKLMPFMSKK